MTRKTQLEQLRELLADPTASKEERDKAVEEALLAMEKDEKKAIGSQIDEWTLAADMLSRTQKEAERFPHKSPESEAVYKKGIDDMIRMMAEFQEDHSYRDFSKEKEQPEFARNDVVVLRPINSGDVDFYIGIRRQHSLMFRDTIDIDHHSKESLFLLDVCHPESFFCVIEEAKEAAPIGYIGIKNTRFDIWEIAVELDKQYLHQGYGSQSIVLFLNELCRLTGHTSFQAVIESDNIPSQGCFEKVGAKLIGLCRGGLLKTPEEQDRFEKAHPELIDDHILSLADCLGVMPGKLLSHTLDYRLECPL